MRPRPSEWVTAELRFWDVATATIALHTQAANRRRHLDDIDTLDSARLNMIVSAATKRAPERLALRYAVAQREMLRRVVEEGGADMYPRSLKFRTVPALSPLAAIDCEVRHSSTVPERMKRSPQATGAVVSAD